MRRTVLGLALICSVVLMLVATDALRAQRFNPAELNDVPRERRAQTGMKFLEVPLGARASALAGAVTAGEQAGAMSMFYNPASLSRMEPTVSASVGQVQWIMGMDYNYGVVGYRPAGGRYGVVGFSVRSVDYGTFNETIRFDNEQGYKQLGTYSPSGTALALGYSRVISDRFTVGANAKYASQSLSNSVMAMGEGGGLERKEFDEATLAWDFGIAYRTGFRGLTFAMNVRNIAREVTYAEESFELPLTFRIGLAADLLEITQMPSEIHTLRFAVDAERPRDFDENIRAGLEYVFSDVLALRAGYTYPNEERSVSLGGGVHTEWSDLNVGADYSYTSMGLFDNVHRISLSLGY